VAIGRAGLDSAEASDRDARTARSAPEAHVDPASADRGSLLTRIVVTTAIVGLLVFGLMVWVASGSK
jgi:hypothetical protein